MLPAVFCLALGAADPGATLAAEGSVSTWAELDTNAKRVPSGIIDDDPGELAPLEPIAVPQADGLVRLEAVGAVDRRAPGLTLHADGSFGLKLFLTQETERMLAAQGRATLSTTKVPGDVALTLATFGKVRTQHDGTRSYGLLRGDAVVERALGAGFAARVGVSGTAFSAFDSARFSSAGGGALVGVRLAVTPQETVDVFLDVGGRGYPFSSRDPPRPDGTEVSERRLDGTGSLVLTGTSARLPYLSGSYALSRNVSNAKGESYTRHRLSLVAGMRLGSFCTATMRGGLQLTQYDDGVSLGQSYFLGDDEETQNVLEITLSRPLLGTPDALLDVDPQLAKLFGRLHVEARASFYGNELASEGARFSRQTAALGLRADFL